MVKKRAYRIREDSFIFLTFNFCVLIIADIQYYFVLVSYVQHSG